MSKVIERIKGNAEALAAIRAQINEIEEAAKAQTDVLKMQREDLQAALIADLKKEGLATRVRATSFQSVEG
jgi:Tfp pilus assembly protein PilO